MSAVWISKASWDKVWSALHNIRIRQDFTVLSPSAGITGTGSGACLNIDLPGTASSSGTADSGVCLARITGVSANQGYDTILYADGLDNPYTGTAVLFATQLALTSIIPNGTVVIAYKSSMHIVGGSD